MAVLTSSVWPGTPVLLGLWMSTVSFAMSGRGTVFGASNCIWVTKFVGSSFQLLPRRRPLCVGVIPGKTVSSSS